MDNCTAQVTVYIQPEAIARITGEKPIDPEEVEIQCDRPKDHEGDHETWIPSYGYVRFPKKALG